MPDDGRRLEDVALSREPVLRALAIEPRTKRELTDALDSSRSTVDRAIRELLDVELVAYAEGRYAVTLPGECALDAVETFHRRTREVSDAVDVLGHLPPDTPLDSRFLDGADVYAPTPEMPDGVVQRLFDSVENASRLRGVAPVVLSSHLESFYDAAKTGDARIEMIIDGELLDQLVATPSTRDVLIAQLKDDRVTLSYADVPFSFGLWITETEAGVVVYSDTGVRGLVVNDGAEAYSWAERRFEDLRDDARTLTTEGIDPDEE